MAQLTLTEAMTFVRLHIPNLPQLNVGTFVNLVLEEVYERLAQIQYSTVTTRAPTTSGTVNVTNDNTAVTFSGSVLLTTDALRLVQIGDDATWYGLTRNAADTAGVLSSKYAGTTNTTATYKIVYPVVTFPSAVGQVLSIKREGYEPLVFDPSADLRERTLITTTGVPMYWSPYTFDSAATPDDSFRALLRPFPDAQYPLAYQFLVRPTLVDPAAASPSTEKIAVPTSFRQAILYGALALAWYARDKDEPNPWEEKAEAALRKAMAHGSAPTSMQREGVMASGREFYAIQYPPS